MRSHTHTGPSAFASRFTIRTRAGSDSALKTAAVVSASCSDMAVAPSEEQHAAGAPSSSFSSRIPGPPGEIDVHRCQSLAKTSTNVNAFAKRLACDNAGMPDLVKVLSVPSIMEGEIVKARLEGEGIPVLLKGGGSRPVREGRGLRVRPDGVRGAGEAAGRRRERRDHLSPLTIAAASGPDQRLEYCGALRAFLRPYLRRSFSRASRER